MLDAVVMSTHGFDYLDKNNDKPVNILYKIIMLHAHQIKLLYPVVKLKKLCIFLFVYILCNANKA